MRASKETSASLGTLVKVRMSSDRRLAIISGSAAFFAPEIGMTPLSVPPPVILMRSMQPHPREGLRRGAPRRSPTARRRRPEAISPSGVDEDAGADKRGHISAVTRPIPVAFPHRSAALPPRADRSTPPPPSPSPAPAPGPCAGTGSPSTPWQDAPPVY